MSRLSGALVCAVGRGAGSTPETWERHRQDLQAAYDQFVVTTDPLTLLIDLRVVVIHLAPGGDDFVLGLPWPRAFSGPRPSFVNNVFVHDFTQTTPTPGESHNPTPRRGWVPKTQTYLDLFDDRQEAGEASNAYVPHFGHPPKDFLICVDSKLVENRLVFRRRRRVSGLEALGISNNTIKMTTYNRFGFAEPDDQHGYRDDMLITAIRAVRDHFGTATEVSEFSQFGYSVDQPNTPNASEQESRDSLFGALARLLNRVFVMQGLG